MMRMTMWSRWSATLMLSMFLLVAGCSARASNPVAPVTSSARTSASNPISQLDAGRAGGEREGGEANDEGERGEGGERGGEGGAQRLSITLSDSAIQPSTLTARAGLIEFDIVNHGQKVHTISVTGGEDQQNLGSVDPGKTLRVQGNLPPGTYDVAVDPSATPSPGPTASLTVR
jgi:hypothetical protein